MLKFEILPVTPFQQNCSVIWCEQTREAAVVDPGGEIERIVARVRELEVTVVKIILTHGHLDHVGGTAALKAALNVPVVGPHKDDLFWLDALDQQAQMMNFAPVASFETDLWLNHGDTVTVGHQTLEILLCPGHTPGHVVLFDRESRLAFVGDVLFKGSIGRTDFPRGDHAALIHAIKTHLWPLGDDVTFIPGHGPLSTFGFERQHNPYVGDADTGQALP
ncbi:MBL fold metallo-hydrolase [Teredinibacter purpureus]|uniref:MBL fold metallo-hydrolase n=1 Tax=Teredinibacter purpureus TaxID=2731756 RepID=UPI0005F86501|nr:MBL fold metallo-hydrolase [Teredinibacter purpureus]